MDLGSTHTITRVVLHWGRAYAKAYQVQVSTDKVHWTSVYGTARGSRGTKAIRGLHGRGRYVRIYASRAATRRGYALRGLGVYGKRSAASTSAVRAANASGATWFGNFDCHCFSNGAYMSTSFVPGHVYFTQDPAGNGHSVAAFAINNGDVPYNNAPCPRGDLFSPAYFTPGTDYYMSIPVKIPTGLPLAHDNGTSFFQWAQIDYPGNSEPSLGLNIGAHGDTVNHYDLGMYYHFDYAWVGPRVDGRWHTAILHVHFEPDNTGFVQLWWDGVRQTFDNGSQTWYGPTLTPSHDGQYHEGLDVDLYRARGFMPGTVTIYHGAPAIGKTYQSVAATVPAALNGA